MAARIAAELEIAAAQASLVVGRIGEDPEIAAVHSQASIAAAVLLGLPVNEGALAAAVAVLREAAEVAVEAVVVAADPAEAVEVEAAEAAGKDANKRFQVSGFRFQASGGKK